MKKAPNSFIGWTSRRTYNSFLKWVTERDGTVNKKNRLWYQFLRNLHEDWIEDPVVYINSLYEKDKMSWAAIFDYLREYHNYRDSKGFVGVLHRLTGVKARNCWELQEGSLEQIAEANRKKHERAKEEQERIVAEVCTILEAKIWTVGTNTKHLDESTIIWKNERERVRDCFIKLGILTPRHSFDKFVLDLSDTYKWYLVADAITHIISSHWIKNTRFHKARITEIRKERENKNNQKSSKDIKKSIK
jgi:hypothetical protein